MVFVRGETVLSREVKLFRLCNWCNPLIFVPSSNYFLLNQSKRLIFTLWSWCRYRCRWMRIPLLLHIVYFLHSVITISLHDWCLQPHENNKISFHIRRQFLCVCECDFVLLWGYLFISSVPVLCSNSLQHSRTIAPGMTWLGPLQVLGT